MSPERPAAPAKLPIIRNNGSTANWELVRKDSTSVASTVSAGPGPSNSAMPSNPVSTMAAPRGTMASTMAHMTMNSATARVPGTACAAAPKARTPWLAINTAAVVSTRSVTTSAVSSRSGTAWSGPASPIAAAGPPWPPNWAPPLPASASRNAAAAAMTWVITVAANNAVTAQMNG